MTTTILLVVALLVTLWAAIWLALGGNAAMALPLVIVFAGLVRTLIRRWSGQRGITPAEVAPPSHDERPRP